MVGGVNGADEVYSDTWEWDGAQWTQVGLSGGSPGKRFYHAMTFDTARGKTILLGGIDSVKENSYIVWDNLLEWDGNEWSEYRRLCLLAECILFLRVLG